MNKWIELSDIEKTFVIDDAKYDERLNQVNLLTLPKLNEPVMTNRHSKPMVVFMGFISLFVCIFTVVLSIYSYLRRRNER